MRDAIENGLKLGVLTWNMANNAPSQDDIDTIYQSLTNDAEQKYDAIVVMAQEETADDDDSLAVKLAKKFQNDLKYEQKEVRCCRRKSLTFTSRLGAMSLAVISTQEFSINKAGEYTHRNGKKPLPNKGGHFADINFGDYRFQVAGLHLESYQDDTKVDEVENIMRRLDSFNGESYLGANTIGELSVDFTILGGDLNYRDYKNKDENIKQPLSKAHFAEGPAKHLSVHGFAPVEFKAESPKTYKGDFKHKRRNSFDPEAADKDRPVGIKSSNEFYTYQGQIDAITARGAVDKNEAEVIELPGETSDHSPVFTKFECHNNHNKNKKALLNIIAILKPLASEKVIKNIESMDLSAKNDLSELKNVTNSENSTKKDLSYLEMVFDYYSLLKMVILEENKQYKTDDLLSTELKTKADNFFGEKENLADKDKREQFIDSVYKILTDKKKNLAAAVDMVNSSDSSESLDSSESNDQEQVVADNHVAAEKNPLLKFIDHILNWLASIKQDWANSFTSNPTKKVTAKKHADYLTKTYKDEHVVGLFSSINSPKNSQAPEKPLGQTLKK